MQKIEECDSTIDSESHTSHYPFIRSVSVSKKSVHFESNFSIKNSLTDTIIDSPSDNLNVIRKIRPKNNSSSKLTSTKNNLIPLKKRRQINLSTSKYLVCFKNSSSKKEKSLESSDDVATSKIEAYDNLQAEKSTPKQTKTENSSFNNNIHKKSESFESNQSNFEFNKNVKEQNISEGFSTSFMKIFRQFNLKNQCCCR